MCPTALWLDMVCGQVQQECDGSRLRSRLQVCATRRPRRLAQPRSGRLLRRRPLLVLHATEPRQANGREPDGTDMYGHLVSRGTAIQRQDEPLAFAAQGQVSEWWCGRSNAMSCWQAFDKVFRERERHYGHPCSLLNDSPSKKRIECQSQ